MQDTQVQIIAVGKNVRNRFLIDSLNEQRIDFEIVDGPVLDYSEYSTEKFHNKQLSKLICSRWLSKGEIGCALAHITALENFLNSRFNYCIILEDDASVLKKINLHILRNLIDTQIPRLVALGWTAGFGIKSNYKKSFHEFYPVCVPTTGAYAYAVNRAAAETLLSFDQKIIDLPDFPIHSYLKVDFWAADPPWLTTDFEEKHSIIGTRAPTISSGEIWQHRINLVEALLRLTIQSWRKKIPINFRQIFIRLFLRDYFFKRAKNAIEKNEKLGASLIPIPKLLEIVMIFFRLYK